MVLAERNSELVRNGRRSRGPSPNNGHGVSSSSGPGVGVSGTGTPETSSDDDNSIKRNGKSKAKQSEYEEKIRVGRDYQAVCPLLVPEIDRKLEAINDRALLVWSPTKEIPDTKLEEYISVAKEKYGYNGEQALGMLFWHKHDLERAVVDLANFTPFPDEWTVEDKVLFEQAFQFHGKSFHRIRQMLPDKSIASLVKYYYSWKKTRHRQGIMDRPEKAKASKEGSDNGSDNGSNEESDEDKVQLNKQAISTLKQKTSETAQLPETPSTESVARPSSRWSSEELLLAVQGVRKYGKDFQAIAETLSTKNEGHVRTFYMTNRRRYNLDLVLKMYEADKQATTANTSSTEVTTTTTKKEESKKIESTSTADESDNTTSSETTASKVSNLETKLATGTNSNNQQKDDIMEIDLEEPSETVPSSPKKVSLPVGGQDMPKSAVV